MDKHTFAEHFVRAVTIARDGASNYVEEHLPDQLRFRVVLNSSYDGNPLHVDEVVFPEDSSIERDEAQSITPTRSGH